MKKKINVTSTAPMAGDESGETFVKTEEALKEEVERLKGMKVPILDENGKPTGRFLENLRFEGKLVGDADIPDDKLVSINYESFETADGSEVKQHRLFIKSIYYTPNPRYVGQRADSDPGAAGTGTGSGTGENPPPPVDYEGVAKEYLKSLKVGVSEDALKSLKGKTIKEQVQMLQFAKSLAPQKPAGNDPNGEPGQGKATGNDPVIPTSPNANTPGGTNPNLIGTIKKGTDGSINQFLSPVKLFKTGYK